MYCAGRERAAQPGAPALPAAGAVRGGGYQGNRFAFPGARRLCPRAVRPPDLPRALGRSSCCSRSGTSREGRDGSDKPMCGHRSCWAASTCCPGKQPSESRLCENKRGLGQAGLGLCRIRPSSSSLSCRSPQWPWGRCPQSQDMPRHVSSCVVFSSAKAPTAAPLLWEQPVLLATCHSPQLCCS